MSDVFLTCLCVLLHCPVFVVLDTWTVGRLFLYCGFPVFLVHYLAALPGLRMECYIVGFGVLLVALFFAFGSASRPAKGTLRRGIWYFGVYIQHLLGLRVPACEGTARHRGGQVLIRSCKRDGIGCWMLVWGLRFAMLVRTMSSTCRPLCGLGAFVVSYSW